MSCGPVQLIKDIAETTDQALAIADKAANLLPYGVATTAGFVEAQLISKINDQVALIKDFIDNPLAAVGGLVPGLPNEIQTLINKGQEFTDVVGPTLTGAAATVLYVNNLKDKYSNVDVDIDNVVALMQEIGNDLDSLCKIVPNIQDVGGELVVKGFPVSFPDISPGTILSEGKFPDVLGQVKDAAKNVTFDFIPDSENQGVRVSEQPGAPYRINGRNRNNRKRTTFLDDLTDGGFGSGTDVVDGFVGDVLDNVESAIDNLAN